MTMRARPAATSCGSVNDTRGAMRAPNGVTTGVTRLSRASMPIQRSTAGGRGGMVAARARTSRSSSSVDVQLAHDSQMLLERGAVGSVELAVEVIGELVRPLIGHFKCFRRIIRALCSCAFDVPAEISSSVAIS